MIQKWISSEEVFFNIPSLSRQGKSISFKIKKGEVLCERIIKEAIEFDQIQGIQKKQDIFLVFEKVSSNRKNFVRLALVNFERKEIWGKPSFLIEIDEVSLEFWLFLIIVLFLFISFSVGLFVSYFQKNLWQKKHLDKN